MEILADVKERKGKSHIWVTFPYDRRAVELIKEVNGRSFVPPNEGGPAWKFPMDLKVGRELREKFGEDLKLTAALKAWGNAENKVERNLRSMASADDAELVILPHVLPDVCRLIRGDAMPEYGIKGIAEKRPDRAFQRADIAYMAERDCINANQPGLGKTIEVIAAIFEGQIDDGPQLVITPKTSVRSTWVSHLETWQPHPVLAYTLEGTSKKELERILAQAAEWARTGQPFWFVTNAAQVAMKNEDTGKTDDFGEPIKREVPKTPELFSWTWNSMTVDEYHKVGLTNSKTMTSKAVLKIPRNRTYLLSGTPMGGKPVKLFAGLQTIAPKKFTSKWRWAGQWLEIEETEYSTREGVKTAKKIEGIRSGMEEEFYEYHAPHMLRRTKAEVLPELPGKIRIDVLCEMTPTQAKQYKQVAADTEIKIDTEKLPITSILAEYTRLRQFSDARCTVTRTGDDSYAVTPTTDSGKLPHLMRILERLGIAGADAEGTEQLVVFSQFSQVVDMVTGWLNEQGIPAAKITGATKQAERERIAGEFQQGTGAKVLVMTTTAGGTSLTLDAYCSNIVIFDETWDPDDQEQAEDRVHRASRMHQVTVYYLRSKDGIEQYIQMVVDGKLETNKAVLDIHRLASKELALT